MRPTPCLLWIVFLTLVKASLSSAAYLTENQFDFWCDGTSLTSLATPEVLPVEPDEIDHPANSGLTLLGTAAAQLLRQVVVSGGDQIVSDLIYDKNFRTAMIKKYFPRGSVDRETSKKMQQFIDAGSTEPHIGMRERTMGSMTILSTIDRIKHLIEAGANVDTPMFDDLCLTPRDLILRAYAESPALTQLDDLVRGLVPESVPPNEKAKQFLQRPFRNDPKAKRFFDLSDSPLKPGDVAALVPTKMRPCKIPPSPPLSLCRNRASRESVRIANLWNPVGAPPSGDPSRDVAWFATLGSVSTVAREQFFYRDGRRCRKIFDPKVDDDCERSIPLAAKLGDSLRHERYRGRRGAHDLRGDEVLPDGYHLLGEPPALYTVRAGVVERTDIAVDAPVAFIGPDIASHHDVVAPGSEAETWDDAYLVAQLTKLPAIVSLRPAEKFDCDAQCRAALATEAIAATADWKHHLRPLAADALFAVDTDLGLFIDNVYFASTSQIEAAARARRKPQRGELPKDANAAAAAIAARSVLGRDHAPFVGYTLLPASEIQARSPQYRNSQLQQAWKSYPRDCAIEVALTLDAQRDASVCGPQARTLRLSVESGPLADRVIALVEDNRVVLSGGVCLVDARDEPLSGWGEVCTGARRRIPLVVVLRHELGHSLGLHDIGTQEENVADVMDETIDQTMRFTAQSRRAARAAITSPGSTPRHVNGMLRLADDGSLEHVEH